MRLRSDYPEKLGELVSHMHVACVQKVMKSLEKERMGQRTLYISLLFAMVMKYVFA